MTTFQQLKQNIGHTWENIAEGWDHLTRKASNAITRFTSSDPSVDISEEEHRELLNRNAGWGVMAAEVFYDNDRVVVRVEAPGLDAKAFDLQVIDDVLVIRGEKNIQREHTEGQYHVKECAYGRFERVIGLPDVVDPDQAKAEYKKGILRIDLPKTIPNRRKTIKVHVS